MKYDKPEVTVLASSVDAIQSSQVKLHQRVLDSMSMLATNAAYEADE